jgi:hypothetical protein
MISVVSAAYQLRSLSFRAKAFFDPASRASATLRLSGHSFLGSSASAV